MIPQLKLQAYSMHDTVSAFISQDEAMASLSQPGVHMRPRRTWRAARHGHAPASFCLTPECSRHLCILHILENNQKWMLLKQHKAEPTPARWLAVKVPAC
jgi:hypothetical protein